MSNVRKLRQKDGRNKARMKRGHLKRFAAETINAGHTIDRSHIPQDAQAYFEYRKHARYNPRQDWLDTLFPGVQMDSAERLAALAKIETIADGFAQTHFILEFQTKKQALYSFFDAKKSFTYLVEKDRKIIRRSLNYSCRELALDAYHRHRVTWVSEETLEFPEAT